MASLCWAVTTLIEIVASVATMAMLVRIFGNGILTWKCVVLCKCEMCAVALRFWKRSWLCDKQIYVWQPKLSYLRVAALLFKFHIILTSINMHSTQRKYPVLDFRILFECIVSFKSIRISIVFLSRVFSSINRVFSSIEACQFLHLFRFRF